MFPLFSLDSPDTLVPLAAMAIPIVAITGGIIMGVVRSLGRQRAMELAQQERIAAIQRGIDPKTLPPITLGREDLLEERSNNPERRAQGLMIGGLVTLFAGIGIAIFLGLITHSHEGDDHYVWAVGLIPMMVGLALLISARLVWPRTVK